MRTPEIQPAPTPQEAAAIVAALEALDGGSERPRQPLTAGRWELAGRLGYAIPAGRDPGGSPWSRPRLGREV